MQGCQSVDAASQRLAAVQCDTSTFLNQEREQGTEKQFSSSETDTILSSQVIHLWGREIQAGWLSHSSDWCLGKASVVGR